MSEEQYAQTEALCTECEEALKTAFEQDDPAGEPARKACELHKRWLCCFWDSYSKEAHMGLAQLYADDLRFAAYYDRMAVYFSGFLRDAVAVCCGG